MFDGAPAHLAAQDAELVLEGKLLGADILTAQEAHAAEDSFIGPDHFKVLPLLRWSRGSIMNRAIRFRATAPIKSGRMLAVPQAATQQPHSTQRSSS